LPFYDRLDSASKASNSAVTPATAASFDWLAGTWSVYSTGYAKTSFKGRKEFSWQEPQREIFFDENHHFYTTFKDSTITITTKDGRFHFRDPNFLVSIEIAFHQGDEGQIAYLNYYFRTGVKVE
jgi:hypothetical protein